MAKKKVILFIVEGASEYICLGSILNYLLSGSDIRFEIINGDITSRNGNNASNIVEKLGEVINHFRKQYKFMPKDFLEVIQLVDTDGVFIPDDKIVYSSSNITLYMDNIITNIVEDIKYRNKQKSDILKRLITLNKVCKTIPYTIYFFSCNLDHVLHGNANLTKEEKINFAHNFEKYYMKKPEDFIELLYDSKCFKDENYLDTWDFIKLVTNSLKKFNNFYLYFSDYKNKNYQQKVE